MNLEEQIREILVSMLGETEEKKVSGVKLSVSDAANILGKSQQYVRVGLQRNLLPIGSAVKMSSIYTYDISEHKLRKYIGDGPVDEFLKRKEENKE